MTSTHKILGNLTDMKDNQLSRRQFTKGSLGVIAVLAANGLWTPETFSAPDSVLSQRKILVGAHPWIYAATQPGYDIYPILETIFADMSFAGLDAIELMDSALRPDNSVEHISALSKKYRLPVLGTSYGGAMWEQAQHAKILADAQKIVPRLALLGGRTMGISVGAVQWGKPIRKTEEQLDAQAELLRKIDAICVENQVVMNLHNHTYEVENNLHDLKGTLSRKPDSKLGPDLNWLVRGGVDPVEFIRTYGKKIVFLHLRDQKADGKWCEAIGEGNMDYVAIGKALREVGFAGDAVIELAHESGFKPTRPLRESLKMSRDFVRKTMGF